MAIITIARAMIITKANVIVSDCAGNSGTGELAETVGVGVRAGVKEFVGLDVGVKVAVGVESCVDVGVGVAVGV